MKKIFSTLAICAFLYGCKTQQTVAPVAPINPTEIAATITEDELREMLYVYASDEFEGRDTGTPGHKKAVEYLKKHYVDLGIASPLGEDDYFQEVPLDISSEGRMTLSNGNPNLISENVIAFIEGRSKPDEYVVISAHLDHVGIEDGEIYNGADDDGSGTVAILEIAEAFQEAVKKGQGPRRSVVFLHVTAEEKGLVGSRYYTDVDPVFPLEQTVANLNIDMIGRIDPKRESENRNYVYLIGSDKLSQELHELSEAVNATYTKIELDYKYNDKYDPNRFYYRSDHYNFAKNNIPVIFYFNGTHADYHKPSDTVEKIEYDLLTNRTKLIFHTAWEIAFREDRIRADKLEATAGGN